MSQHVDTVQVSVKGLPNVNIVVQGFELSIAVNAIPAITLDILPVDASNRASSGSNSKSVTASAIKFKELTSLYYKLADMAIKADTTATIDIDVNTHGENSLDGDQHITLKDWVLTDAGLSSVTSYSAPTLTVVFKHRIVKLDRTGDIYEVPSISNPYRFFCSITGDNMVALMDDLYNKFAKEIGIKFYDIGSASKGGSDKFKSVVKSFRENLATNLPGAYLECDSGLFMANVVKDNNLMVLLRASLAKLIQPFFGDGSTWLNIIKTVCPKCIMQVIPTYDKDKLRLEPYSPWQFSSYTIQEESTEAIDVASVDPDPICGMAIQKTNPFFTLTSNSDSTRKDGGDKLSAKSSVHAFYIPEGVTPENAVGRIDFCGDCWVVTSMLAHDKDIERTTSNADAVRNSITDYSYTKMNEAYARAMFESLYRRGCVSAIVSKILFKDEGGNVIYPGRVATIYDKDDNSKIFYGYLLRIVVKGTASGGCISRFDFKTTRPASGNGMLVKEGTMNPCYRQPGE